MPTIHIHATNAQIGDIVEYVLNLSGEPTEIRIDQDDQPAAHVATDVPWYQQPYPSGNDYAWAIERAEHKRARYLADEADYDRVTSMDCPFCGAVAGKPCVSGAGRLYKRPSTHAARKAALGEWETATPAATRACHPAVAHIAFPLDEM